MYNVNIFNTKKNSRKRIICPVFRKRTLNPAGVHIFVSRSHKSEHKNQTATSAKLTQSAKLTKPVTKSEQPVKAVTKSYDKGWCEVYRPSTTDLMIGRTNIIEQLNQWLVSFEFNPKHKMCILWGRCGTGKTTTAHTLLKHHSYQIVEVNASMVRSYRETMLYLTETCLRSDFLKSCKVAIILDEIDGAFESDKGSSITAIRDFLHRYKSATTSPIICICNEPHLHSIRATLFPLACVLKFHPFKFKDLFTLAQRIITTEDISIPHNKLSQLITAANGDARQVIYALQLHNIKTADQTLCKKDSFDDIFSRVKTIFSSTNNITTCDTYLVGLLFENYLKCVRNNNEELSTYADVFSCFDISRRDEFEYVLTSSMPVRDHMKYVQHVSKSFFKSFTKSKHVMQSTSTFIQTAQQRLYSGDSFVNLKR